MLEPRRLEDLTVDQLKTVLAVAEDEVSDEQLLAIRDFVWRLGGIAQARRAVELLRKMRPAA